MTIKTTWDPTWAEAEIARLTAELERARAALSKISGEWSHEPHRDLNMEDLTEDRSEDYPCRRCVAAAALSPQPDDEADK
jgi:hypothetical protein